MTYDTDIVIVGGGLNGCTLGLALAQVGQKVVVVDYLAVGAHTADQFDGRAYSLALATRRMLTAMGVWNDVADKSQPILDIIVSHGKAGEGASPYFVHFDHRELEQGPMGHMVEDRFLRRALLDTLTAHPNVTHRDGVGVTGHVSDASGVTVHLDTGDVLNAKLVIGCDGRASPTAERAGIKRSGWDYDQTSLVCAVEHEKPHNGTAHQFFMPAGPLAILPLPGNRSSIVWTESTDRANEINARSDSGYLEALRPCFGDFLGEINLVGERFAYPLGLSLAQSFVTDRVALVGDAAHGIHPLAGQGLNLGLRDVAALTEVIANAARRGEDIGTLPVLQRYQQWRRFDTSGLAVATDTLNRLFSNDNPILSGLRGLGLASANAIPKVRQTMMAEAAGLTGELPQLMQGRVL